MSLKKAFDLLRELETVFPPPVNRHHSITYTPFGNLVTLSLPDGRFRDYTLDDYDLTKTIKEVAEEIVGIEYEKMKAGE